MNAPRTASGKRLLDDWLDVTDYAEQEAALAALERVERAVEGLPVRATSTRMTPEGLVATVDVDQVSRAAVLAAIKEARS